MTAVKLDKSELKERFRIRYYGERVMKDGRGNRLIVDSYHVTYKEPRLRTQRVFVSSELACWRVIDLAMFFLQVKNGEDVTFPENHKVLERKAFSLVHPDEDYNLADFKKYR